jgi:hypothetical protein
VASIADLRDRRGDAAVEGHDDADITGNASYDSGVGVVDDTTYFGRLLSRSATGSPV